MYIQPSTGFKYFHFCHILERPFNLLFFLSVAAVSSTLLEDNKLYFTTPPTRNHPEIGDKYGQLAAVYVNYLLYREHRLTPSIDNPFGKRDSHSNNSILVYKILTLITWILSLVVTVYYTLHRPDDGHTRNRKIWEQNHMYRTAFTLNPIITSIYWFVPPDIKSVLLC